jgi:hypothetical protein
MGGGCLHRVNHAGHVVFHLGGVQQGEVAVGGGLTIAPVFGEQIPKYQQKFEAVYQHVYESYLGQGKSLYGIN